MKYLDRNLPNSFRETIEIVSDFVQQEILQESDRQQLYYHSLDHAIAVRRRAKEIFHALESVLKTDENSEELKRLENLIALSAFAHDMVQQFTEPTERQTSRHRLPGVSENATVEKLTTYIQQLNKTIEQQGKDISILFSDRDLAIIREAIMATVCKRDPQAGKASYSFSTHSIYQPYLYHNPSNDSLAPQIVALADLGTLGMEGVPQYIKEGILVFLEDNLDLKSVILQGEYPPSHLQEEVRTRLLNMARFIVSLAEERKARFELEIASFPIKARQILRQQVFIHLNPDTIQDIKNIVPTREEIPLSELIDFFCLAN